MSVIDQTQYFYVIDQQYMHCDEMQFIYQCKACGNEPYCYFCGFDYNKPCEECND